MTDRHDVSAEPPSAAAAPERPTGTAARAGRWLLLIMGANALSAQIGFGVTGDLVLGVPFFAFAGALIVQHYRSHHG